MNADIIIVGAGIVGASFALQLGGSGLQVAVIDPKPTPSDALDGDYDHRVYAITPTNLAFLDRLDLFQPSDRVRLTPIRSMAISADNKATLEFSARAVHRTELATMVEHRLLTTRLYQRLRCANHVRMVTQANAKSLSIGAEDVSIRMDDETNLTALLVVGADGAESWVRGEGGFAVTAKDYDQIAIVANFLCDRPHGQIARQWFVDQGILAWLPLGEKHISIVWSVAVERGHAMIELAPDAFCRAVNAAGDNTLGAMTLVSPIAHVALRALRSATMVKPHIALIGDAAHVIHPLAGQGLNLGLQDAMALAEVLLSKDKPEGFGDIAVLRRFERTRAEAVAAMHGVTDGLQRLFASESKFLVALRDAGLGITDKLPGMKKLLMGHAIG